jgi:hypothetical protein
MARYNPKDVKMQPQPHLLLAVVLVEDGETRAPERLGKSLGIGVKPLCPQWHRTRPWHRTPWRRDDCNATA